MVGVPVLIHVPHSLRKHALISFTAENKPQNSSSCLSLHRPGICTSLGHNIFPQNPVLKYPFMFLPSSNRPIFTPIQTAHKLQIHILWTPHFCMRWKKKDHKEDLICCIFSCISLYKKQELNFILIDEVWCVSNRRIHFLGQHTVIHYYSSHINVINTITIRPRVVTRLKDVIIY